MTQLSTASLATAVHDATTQARSAIGALAPESYAAPSSLPGWSNAHLLAHLDGVTRALARQLAYAARGERIGFYDGGVDGRNERIELGALQQPAALATRVGEGLDLLDEAITDIPDGGWDAATSFRGDGTVTDCVKAAWREVLIHATDLETTVGLADWPAEFSAHLFDFLSLRVPADVRLLLQPTGRQPLTLGEGATGYVVTGMEFDLAAWLAGREPSGPVRATASADGVDLPGLLPWPSGLAPAR
ncbi:maleylpyruvate isomerase family mycothiol-dependent enzyme [Micrococcaceae bacterium RIT802]|nr:maleylpyruvate isomerase family mycothiol-dependent enzyme [Micrococcaceae bacterium RIT 802]